jgi:hypothetical protein
MLSTPVAGSKSIEVFPAVPPARVIFEVVLVTELEPPPMPQVLQRVASRHLALVKRRTPGTAKAGEGGAESESGQRERTVVVGPRREAGGRRRSARGGIKGRERRRT